MYFRLKTVLLLLTKMSYYLLAIASKSILVLPKRLMLSLLRSWQRWLQIRRLNLERLTKRLLLLSGNLLYFLQLSVRSEWMRRMTILKPSRWMGMAQWILLWSPSVVISSMWGSLHSFSVQGWKFLLQTRQLAVPSASALAVHTRSAQMQDKVEQQHLKRLVLDYEQREEAEELKGTHSTHWLLNWLMLIDEKALEARNRAGAIKIRYVGWNWSESMHLLPRQTT